MEKRKILFGREFQSLHMPRNNPTSVGRGRKDAHGLNAKFRLVHTFRNQCFAESRSITIRVNVPGSTGPLLAPAGVGPNFAETMNTR